MNLLRLSLLLNILCMFTGSSLFPAASSALEKLGATASAIAMTEAHESNGLSIACYGSLMVPESSLVSASDALAKLGAAAVARTVTGTALPATVICEPRIEKNTTGKPNIFICQNCNKSCVCRSAFNVHLRMHTREKPYVCEKCDPPKGFSRFFHLKEHQTVHTGERPFACTADGCSQRFAQHSNLRTHMRTHSGEKPFVCGCGRGFGYAGSLKSHKRKCSVSLPLTPEDSQGDDRKHAAITLSGQPPLHHQLPQTVSLAAQGPASLPAQMAMPPYSSTFDRAPSHPSFSLPLATLGPDHPYTIFYTNYAK